MTRPRIGITMGDPSGIGPEIVARAVAAAPLTLRRRITVFGDASLAGGLPDGVSLVACSRLDPADARPGHPTPAGGKAQLDYLEAAVAADLEALVTAPISKTQVKRAGFAFPGHTEFLADRYRAPEHAMMFVGPRLRVVLATIHLPLSAVAGTLTAGDVTRAVTLGARALATDLGVGAPRIGVVGLNPHAGEGGLFGDEERTVILPGIEAARAVLPGVTIDGPLVPDAAFRLGLDPDDDSRARYHLLVAMYHDQGLIPVKLVDFDLSVNVTLGLPIVRTSPDHGVAYDIAGKGVARAESFAAALDLADRMATRRLAKAG
jgi:4-hydroxythreonine-4-phosphate dehydrogenase